MEAGASPQAIQIGAKLRFTSFSPLNEQRDKRSHRVGDSVEGDGGMVGVGEGVGECPSVVCCRRNFGIYWKQRHPREPFFPLSPHFGPRFDYGYIKYKRSLR